MNLKLSLSSSRTHRCTCRPTPRASYELGYYPSPGSLAPNLVVVDPAVGYCRATTEAHEDAVWESINQVWPAHVHVLDSASLWIVNLGPTVLAWLRIGPLLQNGLVISVVPQIVMLNIFAKSHQIRTPNTIRKTRCCVDSEMRRG